VSRPFCSGCTRVRLTADGRLYTCLFAAAGSDLRALLAAEPADGPLRDAIMAAWRGRTDRYSELRSTGLARRGSVEMYRIGG
jgi:GTP 3',8-cyclase